MSRYRFVNSVILDRLKPEGHSFAILHDDSIVNKVEWEQHDEYEILYMEKGYGTFFIGDSVLSCNTGFDDGVLLLWGKSLPHSFYYDNNHTYLPTKVGVYSLLFGEACLGEHFFDLPEMRTAKTVLEASNRGFLITGETKQNIEKVIKALFVSEGIVRIQQLIEIMGLLAESHDLEPLASAAVIPREHDSQRQQINRIIQYIYRHFHHDLTVAEVAQKVHMSPQAFSLFFKHRTGQTFLKFVNHLRVSKVCELLLTTDADITSIAFRCGFNNLANFNRRFKQIKHVSPREFRRQQPNITQQNKS